VSILVDGKIEKRKVEIGINNKVQAQVLSGLNEGDQVILGQSSIKEVRTRSALQLSGKQPGGGRRP